MIYHWWGASLSKKALPIARSKLDGTVCKQAAYPCLSWSAVAMCALTWVVFVPGFFYADRLHSGFSTCVNLKCTVYVSKSSIWPHTNTRAYTHFLQCSPASVCFAFFFSFQRSAYWRPPMLSAAFITPTRSLTCTSWLQVDYTYGPKLNVKQPVMVSQSTRPC